MKSFSGFKSALSRQCLERICEMRLWPGTVCALECRNKQTTLDFYLSTAHFPFYFFPKNCPNNEKICPGSLFNIFTTSLFSFLIFLLALNPHFLHLFILNEHKKLIVIINSKYTYNYLKNILSPSPVATELPLNPSRSLVSRKSLCPSAPQLYTFQ